MKKKLAVPENIFRRHTENVLHFQKQISRRILIAVLDIVQMLSGNP